MASDRSNAAPFPLKVIHALVFWSFCAATVAATTLELGQLGAAWARPLHHGDPPAPLAMAGVALSAAGALVIAAQLLRRRSAPLWASALILLGGALALLSLYTWRPAGRTAPAANTAILAAGVALQKQMLQVLEQDKQLPRGLEAWDRALGELGPEHRSVLRNRAFMRVPYRVEPSPSPEGLPELPRPGTFGLHVAPDGRSFSLRPVGFAPDGAAWPLEDGEGQPLILRGSDQPDGFGEPGRSPDGQ